nr:HlyD family efflux transporter periplasmic adaptor subunit [Pedobacter panaciterrae]
MGTVENIYHNKHRTEEVQHIIERMPTRFGFWVSMIVLFIFTGLLLFGWFIRYPDVIAGQIQINAITAPIKLVANSSGKLKLRGLKSMSAVKEGDVIAYIENSTNPSNVSYLDSLLRSYDPSKDVMSLREKLPHSLLLGELNIKYFTFVNALQEFWNYKQDKLLNKQIENLYPQLKEQKNAIQSAAARVRMAEHTLSYINKFYKRDSVLFIKRVISESEFDKSKMSYLANEDAMQAAVNNLIQSRQAAQQTESRLQELGIQKSEKEKELHIAVISSYNDLLDNIKSWMQKFVFRAPFDGKVQFLKFYTENQFVQAGEQVFTIVPGENKAYGQVILPANGSGKIKLGQEVIAKLDNYPYMEYGSVKGKVASISLTSNTEKTEKGNVETYLVAVYFPEGLKTNYGKKLDVKYESKGTAEIIVNDRKFIQRLFDNLKYVLEK